MVVLRLKLPVFFRVVGGVYLEAISVKGLVKKYGWFFSRRKVVAVNDLSIDVAEKQIFGFLGPNGAGKTTTIKILLGLVIADAGTAEIFGCSSNDKEVKSRVGFLPDSPAFYNHLTGREFVAFCGKLMRLNRMDRYRRADELLEKMGLADAVDQKVEGYSRGMLQRLGIAQALINNPDLIILDEPVSGLDPLGRREVKQILTDLREEGKTVFFSSHILADVQEMCDEVCIMNHGNILVKGGMGDILEAKGIRVFGANLSADVLEKAEPITANIVKEGGRWGFDLENMGKKDAISKFITDNGGTVEDIITKRETLEESFLRRIEEDEAKRKEAASNG